MSDCQELREVLAAGPTKGPWQATDNNWEISSIDASDTTVARCEIYGGVDEDTQEQYERIKCIDARYIAAANPQTIAALLADLDAARVDAARYQLLSDPDFDDREGVFVRNTREGAGAELDAEIARLKELGVEGGR